MRLDKYLADITPLSRSEIKKLLKKKEITVNEQVITDPGYQVTLQDTVTVGGQTVQYREFEYYLLNKPAGYLCTVDYSPNVLELIETNRQDVMPVGRLDKDTEGLLLLTNDGQLAHKLLSPKKHVDKTYYVETDVSIPSSAIETFAQPIVFNEFTSQPARLEITGENTALFTIHEGKFHQVKRMFHHVGCEVTYLERIQFGPLQLGELPTGSYRELTDEELTALKNGSD